MHREYLAPVFLVMAVVMTGCSVDRALRAPEKKNLNVFQPGSSRLQLIAEVGTPASTEYRNGQRVDVFVFQQGESKGWNYLRAAGYGAALVMTSGISEVVAYPVEAQTEYPEIVAQVTYDVNDTVTSLEVLKDGLVIKAEGPVATGNSAVNIAAPGGRQPDTQFQ